jgi:hypothetical protein
MGTGLTKIISAAMAACARKGERKACKDCPLAMYCSAVK